MINFLDILLESHFKHLISLIQTETFNPFEVDFSSFKEVNESTWSGDDNINLIFKFVDMLVEFNSTIDWDDIELFWREFEGFDFISHLYAELSGWKNDKELNVRIFEELLVSESFDDWERICQCFSTSCSVAADEVLKAVYDLESSVLNWEEELDSFFVKQFCYSWVLDEISDVFLLFSFWLRLLRIHKGTWGNDISGHHEDNRWRIKIICQKKKSVSFILSFSKNDVDINMNSLIYWLW